MYQYICLSVGCVLFLVAVFIFRRIHLTGKKIEAARKEVLEILADARGAYVDIRPFDSPESSKLYSGILEDVGTDVLVETSGNFPQDLLGKTVTVYFRLTSPNGDIFKWFRSTVDKVNGTYVSITLPARVAIGQKRLFMRVTPSTDDINMMTIWRMRHGQPLPDAPDQVGIATVCARPDNWTCRIANISGSGVALAFPNDEPAPFLPGDTMLLFIAFRLKDSTSPVFCWLFGEIIHKRVEDNSLILSMKFQNWACPKSMDSNLRWFLCSDDDAAVPILHWVTSIQKAALTA